MLLEFSVTNFLSFEQETVFSMYAGKYRTFNDRIKTIGNTKILKYKEIFGSNASGKTNLIQSLRFMRATVLHSTIPGQVKNQYCRSKPENQNKPSKFVIKLCIDNTCYEYGFEVLLSKQRIVKEWLVCVRSKKNTILFSLDMTKGTFEPLNFIKNELLRNRVSIYAEDTVHDGTVLFLHVMNQNKSSLYNDNPEIDMFKELYYWFNDKLSISMPDEPITQYGYLLNTESNNEALKLLSLFDSGIVKIDFSDEPIEKVKSVVPRDFFDHLVEELEELQANKSEDENDTGIMIRTNEGRSMYLFDLDGDSIRCRTLKFQHSYSFDSFGLFEESDGIVRMIDLLEVLLCKESGAVYVIDELNRCLHPLLTKNFVVQFLSLAAQRDIQLIITTHEAELLDLALVRQDEVCLVDRNNVTGTSQIFGLSGVRFDKRLRSAYLKGEYQGVPNFKIKQHISED